MKGKKGFDRKVESHQPHVSSGPRVVLDTLYLYQLFSPCSSPLSPDGGSGTLGNLSKVIQVNNGRTRTLKL